MLLEAFLATTVTLILGGIYAWVRWSVHQSIEEVIERTINGEIRGLALQVEKLRTDVQEMNTRFESRDVEFHALIKSLKRQNIEPPDIWQ